MAIRQRVSLYFVQDDRLLLMYRWKNGRSFHVLPGGGVEPGETLLEAALREAKEETNYDIVLGPRLWVREFGETHREYAYLVTEFSGKLALGGPELARQAPDNQHIFQWIPLEEIPELDLYPGPLTLNQIEQIRQALS